MHYFPHREWVLHENIFCPTISLRKTRNSTKSYLFITITGSFANAEYIEERSSVPLPFSISRTHNTWSLWTTTVCKAGAVPIDVVKIVALMAVILNIRNGQLVRMQIFFNVNWENEVQILPFLLPIFWWTLYRPGYNSKMIPPHDLKNGVREFSCIAYAVRSSELSWMDEVLPGYFGFFPLSEPQWHFVPRRSHAQRYSCPYSSSFKTAWDVIGILELWI